MRRLLLFLRRPLVLLTLITLLAGVLRFWKIGSPSVWGDEAASWSRACGSWQELTDMLRTTGLFMPGHYVSLWWIKEGFPYWGHFDPIRPDDYLHGPFVPTHRLVEGGITLTPFWLRLVPTLAGVLFIPAIYFLVAQLLGRKHALRVALFSACSAYLLCYSRDAKMYMQFWFLATLSTACFLWWIDLRQRREDGRMRSPLRWLCWLASSCAMVAFSPLSIGVFLIQLLILLTAPRGRWLGLFPIARLAGWTIASIVNGIRGKSEAWTGFRLAARGLAVPIVVYFAIGVGVAGWPLYDYYNHFNAKFVNVKPVDPSNPRLDPRVAKTVPSPITSCSPPPRILSVGNGRYRTSGRTSTRAWRTGSRTGRRRRWSCWAWGCCRCDDWRRSRASIARNRDGFAPGR
jgi:hypothetical protein